MSRRRKSSDQKTNQSRGLAQKTAKNCRHSLNLGQIVSKGKLSFGVLVKV
jgi:hypothetical protein